MLSVPSGLLPLPVQPSLACPPRLGLCILLFRCLSVSLSVFRLYRASSSFLRLSCLLVSCIFQSLNKSVMPAYRPCQQTASYPQLGQGEGTGGSTGHAPSGVRPNLRVTVWYSRHDKTRNEQDKIRQDETKLSQDQDNTRQDKTGQDPTKQHNTKTNLSLQ